MLTIIELHKRLGITLKNMALSEGSTEGNQLFAGDFHAVVIKQTLMLFSLQRDETGNGLSNIKDNSVESFQLQMSVLHQSTRISKAGLSSLSDGWANIKKKVPGVSDSNQNVETTCNFPNSTLQKLKIYLSKGCRKTSKK